MYQRFASTRISALLIAAVVLAASGPAPAADISLPLTGRLVGLISDSQGTPQMGATIQLFDSYDRLVAKTLSTSNGSFSFLSLPASSYSVRVSLSDYLPASFDKIAVRAGLDSMLQVHLATLLSGVTLTATVPRGGMSRDWRSVLRSAPATRPITRFRSEDVSSSNDNERFSRIFTDTHAIFSLAGGDLNLLNPDRNDDLGTGFAVSTTFLRGNQLQVGGSLAQNAGFAPSAMGVSAVYTSKPDGVGIPSPEISVTLLQLGIGGQSLSGINPPIGSGPAIRAISVSMYQAIDLADSVRFEYGASAESVESIGRTTRVSPFARMTARLGKSGRMIASYSDGDLPEGLFSHQEPSNAETREANDALVSAVSSLSRLPQLSYSGGNLKIQRTSASELGYQMAEHSRTYAVSAFAETTSNGRIDVGGATSVLGPGDLMSDGVSDTAVYNIGSFRRNGLIASVDQKLTPCFDLQVAYGRLGGLSLSDSSQVLQPNESIGEFMTERGHNVANIRVTAAAPRLSTKISASYGWMDENALIPLKIFTTQNTTFSPGLNVGVRQPLPSLFGMPGHLEIHADLRNLLTQGYLPLSAGDGHSLLLVQSPRALRGSLNFIF